MSTKTIIAVSLLAGACATSGAAWAQHEGHAPAAQPDSALTRAIAVLSPTQGNNVNGVVTFTKVADGIKIVAHIEGLTPGKHGFHIHQFGDCSAPDGNAAGGHFNPEGMRHGSPLDAKHHAGDMGNIEADAGGVADLEWVDPMMSLDGPESIIGRGLIIHANPDDMKTQPTGNAGARVACGVIGIAK